MRGTKKFWKSLLRNLGKSEELSENIIIHQLDKERQGFLHFVVAVHSLSAIQLFVTPWKHARLPCPLLSPGVCSNSCPLSQWCHPTISPSVAPFSSCPQSFPASGSFPMSLLFVSGGQSIGASALSISLSSEYSGLISFWSNWFHLLAVQGILRSLLQHHSSKASIFWCSAFFMVQLLRLYMTTGKAIPLTIQTFVSKVMSLLFSMMSRFVIAFLPGNKSLLISWMQSPSTVILEAKKKKKKKRKENLSLFPFSPIYLPWIYGTRCHDLHFLNVEF